MMRESGLFVQGWLPHHGSIVFRTVTLIVLTFLPFAFLAAYSVTSLQIFSPDPCVYGECARQLQAGGSLYADTWQDKPPLAIFGYLMPQVIAPGSYEALQVSLGLILLLLAAFSAIQTRSAPAAWLSAMIVVLLPLSHHDLLWASTEHFANIFVLPVLALAWRERRGTTSSLWSACAAGVAVACAFHVRQTTLPVGLFYAAVVMGSDRTLRERLVRLAGFIVGGLSAWLVMIGVVAVVGNLQGYFDTVFLYPSRYASSGSWRTAGRFLLESAQTPVPVVAALLLAATWRTAYRAMAVSGVGVGVLMCLLPQRDAIHYLASMLPFLVLLVWIADSDRKLTASILRVIAVGVTAWGLLAAALTIARIVEAPSRRWMDDVVAQVDAVAPPNATLWVVGPNVATYIQFASGLPPANTFFVPYQLDPPIVNFLPTPRQTIMAQYLEQPPTVLVVYDELLGSVIVPDHPPNSDGILNSRQLLGALLAVGRYRHRASINGFAILIHSG
jgi:hypothetical protein